MPARLGGIGLHNPSKRSSAEYSASQKITSALKTMILEQSTTYSPEVCENQLKAKGETHKQRRSQQLEAASLLKPTLSSTLQHSMALAQEKGASSWLTALPVSEFGFNLHKCAFRDALCLRYGWVPSSTPTNCECGKTFSVQHVLSCPKGGFPSLCHNEIRDITANLLSEVCNNVCIEPHLQPISGEHLPGTTANITEGAHLDIAANGLWGGRFERTYFDVRVFNPHAASNRQTNPYRKHKETCL